MAAHLGSPSLNSTINVLVQVVDINDNEPRFQSVSYSVSLLDSVLPGTSVAQITAVDIDAGVNGNVSYAFTNTVVGLFDVDSLTGIMTSLRSVICLLYLYGYLSLFLSL